MSNRKVLDGEGLLYLWGRIKAVFVAKETGKGLSTNDYTTDEKTKLSGIAETAQVNVLESIQVNGDTQSILDKSVNISVPTNNNQLVNGADYATNTEVAVAVANAGHLKRTIIDGSTLPPAESADVHTIYMLPITGATGDNQYTEWMVIGGVWEKTGSSDVDLTGYLQDSELVAITNNEIDIIVAS